MAFLCKIPIFFAGKKFQEHLAEANKIDDGPPARYKLETECTDLDNQPDEESKLKRFTFGKRDPKLQNRTVLLVGATGTGKSTLINALVNFVMGVTFDDRVWFEITEDGKDQKSQSHSQTTAVSMYEVFGFEKVVVPYSLTIIDTPGYGDTRGIEYDDIITKKLQDLFCGPEGVDTIDAVGLVLKATENRLDERMIYIFNSVTSIFGKNMETNIVAMMTHSDGRRPTNALQALDEANIKYAKNENNATNLFPVQQLSK
ncbi:uncharacterized protein LOC110169038 [Boleophthalmus pectinirostris]|uniref:uncharacterized protein LOC110169038 n=1 Tax=Boleophthalmus pectinirostris TaxID=150288 RepID=UPI00242D54F0|nr:uncharacterized protein LOC110169038 [Boleophthalmus pectinirostris]